MMEQLQQHGHTQISISNNPGKEIQQVLAALNTVFATTAIQPQTREAADRYLTTFQKSSVAWIVADRLLSQQFINGRDVGGNSTQIHFFAAQTLHVKCRADILQLSSSEEQLNSLRLSLMNHLTNYIKLQSAPQGGQGYGAIVTRLAMSLCALAVQMSWDSMVDDLLNNLQQQLENKGLMMNLVLEVVTLLPEEVTSDRLLLQDEGFREGFIQGLIGASEKVFNFLLHAVSTNDAGSGQGSSNNGAMVKVQEQVLRCLLFWIRNINIHPSLLEHTQLLDWTFAILQANDLNVYGGELFDISVDVVIEVLRCYPSDHRANLGLVHKLVPKIMALGQNSQSNSPFQIAVKEEDEDGMRDYCRIFTEMGESYMSLIMHHEDLNQVALVELVLACSAIPDNGKLRYGLNNAL